MRFSWKKTPDVKANFPQSGLWSGHKEESEGQKVYVSVTSRTPVDTHTHEKKVKTFIGKFFICSKTDYSDVKVEKS